MGLSLTQKIIREHLAGGDPSTPGAEIGIRIDQVITPDATGVLCYLQFESMGLEHVRVKRAVAYADHVVYHFDAKNAADHRYLQTAAHKYGSWFSLPGNGICHRSIRSVSRCTGTRCWDRTPTPRRLEAWA